MFGVCTFAKLTAPRSTVFWPPSAWVKKNNSKRGESRLVSNTITSGCPLLPQGARNQVCHLFILFGMGPFSEEAETRKVG